MIGPQLYTLVDGNSFGSSTYLRKCLLSTVVTKRRLHDSKGSSSIGRYSRILKAAVAATVDKSSRQNVSSGVASVQL